MPKLTSKVLALLDLQPHNSVLDIGCGDGQLTLSDIASRTNGLVIGLDSSENMIDAANVSLSAARSDPERTEIYGKSKSRIQFHVGDCCDLSHAISKAGLKPADRKFDRIFSNAAIHWILAPASFAGAKRINISYAIAEYRQTDFFDVIFEKLNEGGLFVAEFGGAGNCAEMHVAFTAACSTRGESARQIRKVLCPWWFPGVDEVRGLVEQSGFVVEVCELEYRPTMIGGRKEVEGWTRLMGAKFLEVLELGDRDMEAVVQEVVDMVKGTMRRADGTWWMGYVRLRVKARKP